MREQMELQIQGNGRCEDSDMLLRDGGALAKTHRSDKRVYGGTHLKDKEALNGFRNGCHSEVALDGAISTQRALKERLVVIL
jgi:hypothetical protein